MTKTVTSVTVNGQTISSASAGHVVIRRRLPDGSFEVTRHYAGAAGREGARGNRVTVVEVTRSRG